MSELQRTTNLHEHRRAWAAPRPTPPSARLKLDFILAGVPKAGTSFLHQSLRASPHLSIPDREVTTFMPLHFSDRSVRLLRNELDESVTTGIKRPDYIFNFNAMQNIRDACGPTKIVVCVRDPVVRFVSHFYHLRGLGQVRRGTLEEIASAFLAGDLLSMGHRAHELGLHSMYDHALQNTFRLFGRQNVLVESFESLVENPAATVTRVCRFLNVPPHAAPRLPFIPQKVNYSEHWQKWQSYAARLEGVCDEAGIVIGYRRNASAPRRHLAALCRWRARNKHEAGEKSGLSVESLERLQHHFRFLYAYLATLGIKFHELDDLKRAT